MHRINDFVPRINTVVVKIGTNLLADKVHGINAERIDSLARSIQTAIARSANIALVSSGAIGAGVAAMKLSTRPRTIPDKQATAAIGQPLLMEAYVHSFRKLRIPIAQILLTKDDFSKRDRYVNARNTFASLFEKGVIPIINENDTVAIEEIRLGDNDNLSAMVATLIGADLLVILSDVDGLYTDDPSRNPSAELIGVVEQVNSRLERFARSNGSELSTGGMKTKIQAARRCAGAGITTVITNGRSPTSISDVLSGEFRGTIFLPAVKKLSKRKEWIGLVSHTAGKIVIDDGAKAAIAKRNKSLLPSGVLRVGGSFEAREVISIIDIEGNEIGKGIAGFSSSELAKIKGKKSTEIETILRRHTRSEVVHRDDLVLISQIR